MNKALNFTPYRLLEDNNVNDVDDNVMGYWIQRSQEIGLRELTCVESHTKKSWMKLTWDVFFPLKVMVQVR
jgi:hypothetical protein